MAPSSGHHLVPKAIRIVKSAFSKTKYLLRSPPTPLLRPSPSPSRHLTTSPLRHSLHLPRPPPPPRKPSTPRLTSSLPRRAFASPLRPNLTGGTLPRSAGGYGLGGTGPRAVRHFSQGTAPGQVLQSVSAACRAFWVAGGRGGVEGWEETETGIGGKRKREVCVGAGEEVGCRRGGGGGERGARVEFSMVPRMGALMPGGSGAGVRASRTLTLGAEGLLDALKGDFQRAVGELAVVLADLDRLSGLGDLPVGVEGGVVWVAFPGCEARRVERLCEEVGVRRGVVRPDPLPEVELRFPFAPGDGGEDADADGVDAYFEEGPTMRCPERVEWRDMMSSAERTLRSAQGSEVEGDEGGVGDGVRGSWVVEGSPGGYESLRESDCEYEGDGDGRSREGSVGGYEGVEGIWRFLRECEGAGR